jgi:CheY-like chemotaxis protein
VLVVDDNLTNRRILTDMLGSWGMQATQAQDVQEALSQMRGAAAASQPFNLVLTDVHMPGVDGFELVDRIKKTPALTNSFILMLTSGEHLGDLARCRELGVSVFLTKPVRRAELRDAIARTLSLPSSAREMEQSKQDIARLQAHLETAVHGAHILLAEDNLVNQRVARAVLEKAGHRVIIAGTGQQAVELWEEQRFDLILMDVQMPDMDGFEATAVIRQKEQGSGRHMPIIAMTAHAMSGDKERCLSAGMDNFLSKPFHARTLLDLVAKYRKSGPRTEASTGNVVS